MEKGLVSTPPAAGWMQPGLHQYFLVVQPAADIAQKVVFEKQWLYEQLVKKPVSDQQPHIRLASFYAREDMEETIIRYMHRVCSQQQGFEVALNNYSGYPPDNIYLRVQDHHPFLRLINELQVINSYINSCGCPPMKLCSNPQLNIASKVPEEIYTKAMLTYAQRTFHETFAVNELVLLRTRNTYDQPKLVNVFRLQPVVDKMVN